MGIADLGDDAGRICGNATEIVVSLRAAGRGSAQPARQDSFSPRVLAELIVGADGLRHFQSRVRNLLEGVLQLGAVVGELARLVSEGDEPLDLVLQLGDAVL